MWTFLTLLPPLFFFISGSFLIKPWSWKLLVTLHIYWPATWLKMLLVLHQTVVRFDNDDESLVASYTTASENSVVLSTHFQKDWLCLKLVEKKNHRYTCNLNLLFTITHQHFQHTAEFSLAMILQSNFFEYIVITFTFSSFKHDRDFIYLKSIQNSIF